MGDIAGEGSATFTGNYYRTANPVGGVNGSDTDGARWMGTIGFQPPVSGNTGSGVFVEGITNYYGSGSVTNVYYLNYAVQEGYTPVGATYWANGIIPVTPEGSYHQFTMPAEDVVITGTVEAVKRDIGYSAWVGISADPQDYTGEPLTAAVTVTDNRNGTPIALVEGTDYYLELPTGECIYPGDYDITVVGMGDFGGRATTVFTIINAGSGTEENPFIIRNTDQMDALATSVNGGDSKSGVHYRLEADLDYTGKTYTTIGNSGSNPFQGGFDGNGHTISHVTLDENALYLGLFGRIDGGGTVKNLTLDHSSISNSNQHGGNTGGIAGSGNGVTITGCVVTENVAVSAYNGYVGGIAGKILNLTISHCRNSGSVSLSTGNNVAAGGIAGEVFASTISHCQNLGCIGGNNYVGGIAGKIYGTGSGISDCLNLGSVGGNRWVGGIAGQRASQVTLTNNYYAGACTTGGIEGNDVAGAKRGYAVSGESGIAVGLQGSTGQAYNGVVYGGEGESLSIVIGQDPQAAFAPVGGTYTASAGTLTENGDTWTMAMPEPGEDITIGSTGTLALVLLDNDAEAEYNNLDRVADHVEETLNVLLQGRTFHKDGTWNALVLPFGLATLTGTPLEGAEVRTVANDSFDNGTLTINLTDPLDAIEAGYPYLLRWPNGEDISNPVFMDVTLQDGVEPLYFDETGLMFFGFYYSDTILDGTYNLYMGSDNKLHYPHAPMPIHSCRAYFSFTDIQLFYDVNRSEMHSGNETVVSLFPAIIAEGNWNDPTVWNTNPIPSPVGEVAVLAEATIPANCTAQAEEIVFLNEGALTIKDGGQLYHNNVGIRATIEKDITAYTPNTKDGYHLIGHSFADNGAVDEMDNLLANDYDLYYYDEPTHYWMNQKLTANNFTELEAAKGYLYANSESQTIGLKGTLNAANAMVNIPLSYEANALKGFNLVGNPFAHNVTTFAGTNVVTEVYRMNATKDNLMVSTISATDPLKPGEGFFVKATAEGASITFNAQTRGGAKATELAEVPTITLNLTQNGLLVDRFILKRDGEPLEKFTLNENATRIYATHGGMDYAVATIVGVGRDGVHTVSTEVPVNFKAAKNGTYTMTFDTENLDLEYLHLIDNLTGADVDLLPPVGSSPSERGAGGVNQPSYTFTAKTTDYESRFKLVFVCEDANDDNDAPFAYISNGDIVVVGPSTGSGTSTLQVVDVMGRVVVSTDVARNVSTSGMAPGVYVLRLIDGDNVRTQRIVID